MAGEKEFVVITPLVIAKTATGDRYLYADAQVPVADLLEGEVDRLEKGGFIADVAKIRKQAEADAAAAQKKIDDAKAAAEKQEAADKAAAAK